MNYPTVLVALASLSAAAFPVEASAQRQIDENGAGNCIFAAQPLAFGKEGSAAYRNQKTEFSEDESVYVRCYYNGTVASHKRHGRLFNSIRNDGHHYVVMSWVRPMADGRIPSHGRLTKVGHRLRLKSSESASWDQQSFQFLKSGDCDLTVEPRERAKYSSSPQGCIDFAKVAREKIKSVGLPPQEMGKFCMEVLLVYANNTQRRWVSDRWVTEQVKDYRKMSGGCFTVKLT